MAGAIGSVIGRIKRFFQPFDRSIERAAVVHLGDNGPYLSNLAVGDESNVTHSAFDFFEAIKRVDFYALYHNHPQNTAVYLSEDDLAVVETVAYTISGPFFVVITNYKDVCTWRVALTDGGADVRIFDEDIAQPFLTKTDLGFDVIAYLEELRKLYDSRI